MLFKHDKTGWAKDTDDVLHMSLLLLGRPYQDNEVASLCLTLRASSWSQGQGLQKALDLVGEEVGGRSAEGGGGRDRRVCGTQLCRSFVLFCLRQVVRTHGRRTAK